MKIKAKQAFTFILTFILAGNLLILPGYAAESNEILSLTAKYTSGRVSFSGTASTDVLAVAILLYDTDGTTLLRMETVGVTSGDNQNSFSGTIRIPLSSGTYTVKAANYEGGNLYSATFTVSAPAKTDNNTGGSSSPATGVTITPTPTPAPVYQAEITTGANGAENLDITLDDTGDNALAGLDQENIQSLFSESNEPVISMPAIPGVNTYTLELPASTLSGAEPGKTLALSTDAGTISIPDNMLSGMSGTEDKKVGISIGYGNKNTLSDKEKEAVGERPLIKLQLTLDGTQTSWNNPDAPVTVSIPYTPSDEELENPDSIVVWYLDGAGNLVCITNGKYDPATGKVTFTTTHFSLYAVGYNRITFSDVEQSAWYEKAIGFIAAREITKGTGAGKFSPEALLTRGEFIVMLMRAYEIKPDDNPAENFADAGNTYYTGYLAAAKRLGISKGVGNNLFAPGNNITRQEMFTLLYNALKVINRIPQGTSAKTLSSFTDKDSIAPWAEEAMDYLIKAGAISGSNGRLNPQNTSTRAEMAQVLYNLLSK
ncbi:MAG: S-layer homology domain-containing protein [Clostridiaceae bacterium]|nr:S-layer homology domain-containing protein [Clostridiaceae bacterium]